MAPFKFRLEQVRLYRKQLEEQAMQLMARAVLQRDTTQKRIENLREELARERGRLSRAESLDGAERWLARTYESAVQRDLEAAVALLAEQEHYVDECRQNLIQKAKDRGLLDSLKEKQAARHARLEQQQEQKDNDETATLRYKPAAL